MSTQKEDVLELRFRACGGKPCPGAEGVEASLVLELRVWVCGGKSCLKSFCPAQSVVSCCSHAIGQLLPGLRA